MPIFVELRGIAKSFGGVKALDGVSLSIDAGQIVGLVGENGAGKSTLIKLLSGVHRPDRGTIRLDGRDADFPSPHEALSAGIATIHQEIEGFPHLTVAENILLPERWPRRRWGAVDWSAINVEAESRLADFGLPVDPRRMMSELTAAQKQEVAIAAALARRARLLILDEPTASLTEPEVRRLLSHLRRLRGQGVTILYVSHRLDEIFELTDRVAVLRDGALVATHRTCDVDARHLVQDIVGRELEQVYPRTRASSPGPPRLELEKVSRAGMFRDVTFLVRAGEIVGLAGLIGAGRSELARAIYGLYGLDSGTMRLCGQLWRPSHPREALERGLVYIPEERKRQGFVLSHSVSDSIGVGLFDRLTRFGFLRARAERRAVRQAIERYDVRMADPRQAVATLSGGNQQKVLLARWLERNPAVVILDDPTRGIDVGAKSHVHAVIDELAGNGKAILLISSDFDELVGMADRTLVMNRGTIEVELAGDAMTTHNLILAASGIYRPQVSSPPGSPTA